MYTRTLVGILFIMTYCRDMIAFVSLPMNYQHGYSYIGIV
jgi:hypothetical protein